MKLPVKQLSVLLGVGLLTSVYVGPVLAVETMLTQIGAVVTNNMRYNQWWVVSENPVLSGQVNPNAAVLVTIGGEVNTVSADTNGYWAYQTDFTEGDNAVVVESDQDKYAFTLSIGNVPADLGGSSTGSGSATTTGELPQAGMAIPTLLIGLTGAGALGGGWWKMRE